MPLPALFRRLRRGQPIVVVSGLPRSGTSMMMRMLAAGGVPILTDEVRPADDSNPKGYFEFEPVKELANGGPAPWLDEARGKAVKIVSFLLTWLPETHDYRVIFMRRDLHEIVASQTDMLVTRAEDAASDPDRLIEVYARHLEGVERFLTARTCFSTLSLDHRRVLANPAGESSRVGAFLERRLDEPAMTAAVDTRLYRHRHS
jgi:hypothetical protein